MKAFTMNVILMLLLMNISLQECTQGCLKCSSDNVCEYCDFTKNFYLKDGTCVVGQIDSCEKYSIEGSCLLCQPYFYLDDVTGQCLGIPETVRIQNCQYYETEQSCMVCDPQFYLDGLICSPVNTTIENCQTYVAMDKCGECINGFIIQHDYKGCLKQQDVSNCQTYTSVRCNDCQPDYYLQDNFWNLWIQHLLQTNFANKAQRAILNSINTKTETSNNCISILPSNCEQLENFQNCHICKTGYFLKDGNCFENPPISIPYCEDYSTETRCKKCQQGYRLTPAPDYKCKAVNNVQHCINFDGSSFDTRCLQCKDRYFLLYDNLCEERTITVEFCVEHEIHLDQCKQCETGYQLTDDGKKCLIETPSCLTYLESDINSEELICQECKDYHYLNIENLCTLGTTDNCRVYERIYDQCKLCEDNYFLNSNLQCEQHPFIDGCKKYDPYINNRCIECQFDRFLLTLQTECQQVQVQNCRLHKTIDNCAECNEGYTLLNNGQCDTLDPSLHCLIGEYGLCIKCQTGYIIQQGLCILQLIYEKDVCQLNEMPIDYKSSLQCTSKEDLVRLGLDSSVYDNGNCKSFEYDEDKNFKCVKCMDNFTPDQTGACVATSSQPVCTDDTTFYYRDLNFKVKKEQENLVYVQDNVCLRMAKDQPTNNCKLYGISKGQFNYQKEVQYGCLNCVDTTGNDKQFKIVDPSSNRETLYKYSTDLFWKTDLTCQLKTDFSDKVWGDVSTLDNCEYFQEQQHDKIGCMRCKKGFSGITINQNIERCLEYDNINLKCIKCQENYLVDENGKKCTYYSSLTPTKTYTTNCELESFDEQKCYLCKSGYTLSNDGSTCTQFTSNGTITNCAAYVHNATGGIVGMCETCDDGYYLSPDKQACWQVNNCLIPASATTCSVCKLTYEKNSSDVCVQIIDCDYNDENSNTCLVGSKYNIKTLNQCTSVTIQNCIEFDQVNNKCLKCSNGNYLFFDVDTSSNNVNLCVANGNLPGTPLTVTLANTDNCKVFGIVNSSATYNTAGRYGCLECNNGFYLKEPNNNDLANFNCIKESFVDKDSDKVDADTNNLLLTEFLNYTNCNLYDFLTNECQECSGATYYLTNGICCAEGQYNLDGTCTTIPGSFTNCDQIQYVRDQGFYECTSCTTGNTLVDGACTSTTPCNNYSHGNCISSAATKCTTFDIIENECDECNSNTYIIPSQRNKCCDNQYYNASGTCSALSTLSGLTDLNLNANIKESCLQYDPISQECLKCASGKTFNGKICVQTSDLYENCEKIDNQNNICEKCKTDYYLTNYGTCCQISTGNTFVSSTGACTSITIANKVTNCKIYSQDAANSCQECKDGYWLYQNKACCKNGEYIFGASPTSSSDCKYPSTNYGYCQFFDFSTSIEGQYSCKQCNQYYSNQFYDIGSSTNTCCPHGQRPDSSGDCLSNSTCKVFDTTTTCHVCPDDKQKKTDDTCVAIAADCIVMKADGSSCHQCKLGKIVDTNASNACSNFPSNTLRVQYYCPIYDSGEDISVLSLFTCPSCNSSLQITSYNLQSPKSDVICCLNGSYLTNHPAIFYCAPIPAKNCAVYDAWSSKCTKCFQDKDHCTVEFDFLNNTNNDQAFQLKYFTFNKPLSVRAKINAKYYLGTDSQQNCCQFGYYFNGNDCVPIEIENCQQYDIKNLKCMKCDNNYILSDQQCIRIDPNQCDQKNTDTDIYYNSNGHCCLEGTFWNQDQKICEYIPDANCKKSDDGIICNECAANYESQTLLKDGFTLFYEQTYRNCPHISMNKSFYACQLSSSFTTIKQATDFQKYEQIALNCDDVDYDKKICKKCLDGYYKPEGVDICCANGEVPVEVSGRHYCRTLSTIKNSNCINFDAKTNKCLECIDCNSQDSSLCQLSGGLCCQRYQHFNIMTGQCENLKLGACKDEDVDYQTKICKKCPEGYYFYLTGCIQEKFVFTNNTMSATKAVDDAKCLQQSPQGHCTVCDPSFTNYYQYRGTCVIKGTTPTGAPTGSGFDNCNIFDDHNNCIECKNSNVLTFGKCCANNEYWDYYTACTSTVDTNCTKVDKTIISDFCLECNYANHIYIQYFLKSGSGPEAVCLTDLQSQLNSKFYWDFTAGGPNSLIENISLAQIQSTVNCIKFKDGECTQCAAGYILTIETVNVDASGGTTNKDFVRCKQGTAVTNCLYHQHSDITQCIYCNGKNILKSDGKCTEIALDYCNKSDATGCLECQPNYLQRETYIDISSTSTLIKTCWFIQDYACNSLETQTTRCNTCKSGYVLEFIFSECSNDLTALKTAIPNCLTGKQNNFDITITYSCTECNPGYILTNSTTCTQVTSNSEVDNCKTHSADNECSECDSGFYLANSGAICCKSDTIFYNNECTHWSKFLEYNCNKYNIDVASDYSLDKIECSECATGYQLTDGKCCPNNTIGFNRFCYTPDTPQSNNCKVLDNIRRCKTCQDNFYLTNGGCCSEGKYFNITNLKCEDISDKYYVANGSDTTNYKCLQLNDDNQCIKCNNNGRLYHGICYDPAHAIHKFLLTSDTITSTNENFPKCSVVINDQCTQCNDTYSLGVQRTSNKCCGKNNENYYYDEENKKCIAMDTNCISFDLNTNTCLKCNSSYQILGANCCQANNYYYKDTQTCTSISSLTGKFKQNCTKITQEDLLNEKCSKCIDNYVLINGLCYKTTEVLTQCNTKSFEDCLTCTSTNIISGLDQSVCCTDGQIFDSTTLACITKQTELTNCKNQLSTTICSECDDNFYLLNQTTCCEVGKKPNGNSCASSVSIAECIQWGTLYGDDICLKCKNGYYSYTFINNNNDYTSVCCQSGKFYDPIKQSCINHNALIKNGTAASDKCDAFNVYHLAPYYHSPVCLDIDNGTYLSNGFVCADTKYFDVTDSKCKDIDTTTYPGCTRLTGSKCLQCSGTKYLIKGKCCDEGKYSNGTNACAASTTKGLVDCKYFYEECPGRNFDGLLSDNSRVFNTDCTATFNVGDLCKECDSGNYLTYNYKCCPLSSYWDTTASECKVYNSTNVDALKHRQNLEDDCKKFGENFECLECSAGKILSKDKQSCCATTSRFIDIDGSCKDTYTIPDTCKIYDHTKYYCIECMPNNYLTEGKCCADNKYYQRSSSKCVDMITTTLEIDSNCIQYDELLGCLKCNTTHLLNKDQKCIQIPSGCLDFDVNTLMCNKCNDGNYLSEYGECCTTDNFDAYGKCKNIQTQLQIDNCEQYFNGKCSQCEDQHYLIQGECCPYNSYYSRTSNASPPCITHSDSDYNSVKDCQQYGHAKEFCNVCKDKYMLVRHLWGDRCIEMNPSSTDHISNCIKYTNILDSTTPIEQVKCTECSFAVGALYKLEDLTTPTTTKDIMPQLKPGNVNECLVYQILTKYQESSFKCIKCSDNYYLQENENTNICVSRNTLNVNQCVGNKPINKDECDQCDEGYYINYLKQCEAIPITDCIHYDRVREICLKCTTSKDVNPAGGYDQSTQDENTSYRKMRLRYFLVNDHLRSECSLEKHTPEIFPDHFLGYIKSCVADSSQSTSLAINLDNFYDKWYSFHFCSDNTKIPITFVKAGENYTGMPYGIGQFNDSNSTQSDGITINTLDLDDIDEQIKLNVNFNKSSDFGLNIKCITNYQDILKKETGNATTHPVANCAMIMTNVEMPFEISEGQQSNPDLSKLSTFCTACKNGYVPVRNGILPIVVNSCTAVQNCDIDNTTAPKVLNGCSSCLKNTSDTTQNYSFKVNQEGIVDYSQCVQTDDIHCTLLNLDNTCKYCEQGYLPNYDGKCSQYKQPNCDDTNFSFQKGFTVDNFEFVLAYLGTHKGCNECSTGYKGLLIETKKLVCSESNTLKEQDFQNSSIVYDNNCEQYGIVNDNAVCTSCDPGYLLNQNRKCIQSTLQNCSIIINATQCAQCSGEYILENGNCVQQVIENCLKHNINDQNDPICTQCDDTYLLKDNVCIKGPIENCKLYNSLPLCIECIDNYVLVTLKDGSQQCSPIDQNIHPNCIQYKSEPFNDNQVECLQCSSLQYLPVYFDIKQDICLQLEVIDNCIKYNKEPLFVHSNLNCLECDDKYVLQGNKCEERKVTVEHCINYSKIEHKCTECSNQYYLSSDGIKCILEPSGISNCDVYADYDLCKHCINNTYLYQNKCISVPTPIKGCKYYRDSSTCSLCSNGLILENNMCKEYKVSCLTYLNSEECVTCPEGQGIKYENGKRICALFNVVQYCDIHGQIEPYECQKCIGGYFLYEELPRNKCVKAITPVSNCIEYSGPEDCSLCADNYLLTIDQKQCIQKTFSDHCISRSEVQPYCIQCQPGYVLNNVDKCIKQSSNLPEGCLGLDKNRICYICNTGYYQDSQKKCIKV